ncbi:hypothetical protein NMG60_11016093 [Bertholletia excelsa]
MAAESSSNHHSSSVLSGDGNNNTQLQRAAWAQVVRGDHEAMPAATSSSRSASPPPPPPPPPVAAEEESTFSDCFASKEAQLVSSGGNNSNVAHPKKPAWNKPLNGVVEGGHVMGGDVTWPALSESTRPPMKSTSDSPKPDSSVSAAQGPVISQTPQNQKDSNANANANANSNPNLTTNNTMPARPRSAKRGVGSGSGVGSNQGGYRRSPVPPPPPPPFPLFEMPYGPLVAPVPEPPYKVNNWDGRPVGGFVSQPHQVNNQHSQPNSSRRGNAGGRHRGDDLHHNSHGGRRDQDRYWNASRSSGSRDIHIAQQIARPRGFLRGPPPPPMPIPVSTPYMGPQYVRPYGTPMGFDMASPLFYVPALPPESFRSVPFIANGPPPAPPMFYPVMDVHLPNKLVEQIDYYFSDGNLVKDDFLRSKMDDEGWVPIELIASFPRVRQLTDNIQLILDSLRASLVVEVQGDKVRRRVEWNKWIRTSGWFRTESGSQSPVGLTETTLATALQKVTLDESTSNPSGIMEKANSTEEAVLSRSSSEPNEEHVNEEACSGPM